MRFWTREVAGWILLGLGLYVFYRSFTVLTESNNRPIEGAILTVVGVFIFRGGIHLLKIAVAARVCMEAQGRLEADQARPGSVGVLSRSTPGRKSSPYTDNASLRS